MTDAAEDDGSQVEWTKRLDRVRKENQNLYGFIQKGEDDGTISKEASRAFFRASVACMARGGILKPLPPGTPIDEAALCTVVAQANHEGRMALLQLQPELKDQLDHKVPPSKGGRAP